MAQIIKVGKFRLSMRNLGVLVGALLAFALFMTTLQVTINGSSHPYTTDTGELQNALPRWGTLHFPGYPLYSVTGSAAVTLLRLIGIGPAAGASLVSAIWGTIAVALLIALDLEYKVPVAAAGITALLFALSTSFWVDASIAEVHTMTIALMLASILFAVRFSRQGRKRDLLLLALFASQTVLHQRAMVLMGPGLLLLALRQRQALWQGLPAALAVAGLGALVYLYPPIRDWQGATWTFNQPGTWRGFWSLAFDTKTGRIIMPPETPGDLLEYARNLAGVLSNEWPLAILALGALGSLAVALKGYKYEAWAILLLWLPFPIVALVIREGQVSDAVLAMILPLMAMAAFGLAILSSLALERSRSLGLAVLAVWLAMAVYLFIDHRPEIVAISRDPGAEEILALAGQIDASGIDEPTTLTALWGDEYWTLAYAQAYLGRLAEVTLVDHNADLGAIMDRERLLTSRNTFYVRPLDWWAEKYGRIYLASFSPEVVEISDQPILTAETVADREEFDLGNGVKVRQVDLEWRSPSQLQVTIYWEALADGLENYRVAVHLVKVDPPAGPADILSQADNSHPVGGQYPVSGWSAGEIVRDRYYLEVPDGENSEVVRISMYQISEDGQFENSRWLSLPVPPR